MIHVALTIAGSDPSGGAGVQADLKTFHQHRVYGMSVITLLTAQNTRSVTSVETITPTLVMQQLDAVVDDIPPNAVKTGALGNAAIIDAVAERAASLVCPLVVDPVMISKHGDTLIEPDALERLRTKLLPNAFLITPNVAEAAMLGECTIASVDDMGRAAAKLATLGPRNVLVKGGKLGQQALDVLWSDGKLHRFVADRIATKNTHGSGCAFAAAITARLARGEPLTDAVARAKDFVTNAIRTNPRLGSGFGPLNLHTPAD